MPGIERIKDVLFKGEEKLGSLKLLKEVVTRGAKVRNKARALCKGNIH